MRRLVLCLDGTWNTEKSFTNVWRIYVALNRGATRSGVTQLVYYDQGVGTKAMESLTGGAFGQGLSRNVLRAYLWLTENYRSEDQIFVIGFSRGAYTARSLVGFLSTCGLLRPDAPVNIEHAFNLYRRPGVTRDSSAAVDLRHRYSLHQQDPLAPQVRFLGVFDTVGALGIPVVQAPLFEDYRWHKVHLSPIVEHAFHAVAIDEHRELYDVALWRNRYPHQNVEQRWFTGAHANVGGGYERDPLSIRPLEWMQQRAKACGLEFDFDPCRVRDLEGLYAAPVCDSWSEFLRGSYALTRQISNAFDSPRFYRTVGSQAYWQRSAVDAALPQRFRHMHTVFGKARTWIAERGLIRRRAAPPPPAVGEVLDYTVEARVHRNPGYRPPNLKPFFDARVWGN